MATKSKVKRSKMWIVTTHAITAGFAMPLLAALAGALLARAFQMPPAQAFLTTLALQSIGYIAGTFHSLAYLRKEVVIEKPSECIRPSIITFAAMTLLWTVFNTLQFISAAASRGRYMPHGQGDLIALCLIVTPLFYIVVVYIFAKATKHGFLSFEGHTSDDRSSKPS